MGKSRNRGLILMIANSYKTKCRVKQVRTALGKFRVPNKSLRVGDLCNSSRHCRGANQDSNASPTLTISAPSFSILFCLLVPPCREKFYISTFPVGTPHYYTYVLYSHLRLHCPSLPLFASRLDIEPLGCLLFPCPATS